jgi:hypothetical protein
MARAQADARALVAADEVNAYYEAQRRATRAWVRTDRAEFYRRGRLDRAACRDGYRRGARSGRKEERQRT